MGIDGPPATLGLQNEIKHDCLNTIIRIKKATGKRQNVLLPYIEFTMEGKHRGRHFRSILLLNFIECEIKTTNKKREESQGRISIRFPRSGRKMFCLERVFYN